MTIVRWVGYANLGALLMASGLPYDSDAGRDTLHALRRSCAVKRICNRRALPKSARRLRRPARAFRRRMLPAARVRAGISIATVPQRDPHAPGIGEQDQ
jgi:hypothetical protein